ncbi:hypothetical protein [Clostridium sp.]|uniref:hypothetical protein n=1 Tax=Clostridium sp. TaxID=1506 RepID=UPI001A4FB1CB|nr:hypothetical protein [Clostridium sp.]MBK5241030.1 hypothetical protein [Clostridium sp.]
MGNLKDVYFIFADDVFIERISYEKFKNLIKFYVLLYDRIIIPDAFIVNNKNLHKFFLEEQGLDYFKKGIIAFTMREEIKDIQDLLYSYKDSKTLNDNIEDDTIKRILNNYNFKSTLKWKLSNVSSNFSKHILDSHNTIALSDNESEVWKDVILNLKEKNTLTRQEIYNQANEKFGMATKNSKMIMQHADIVYNFNLPSMFHISAAYPERLLSNEILSPEKVFFYREDSKGGILQPEDLFSEETLTLDEPLIFYSAIINQLKFENILAIRNTQEFKTYLKSIKENDSKNMENTFYKYCEMCNQLIPNMISANHQEIQKLHTKIQISKKAENVSSGVVSLIIGIAPLGNIASIPIDYLIAKGVQMTGKSLTDRIASDYGIKSIEANRNVKRTIRSNPNTVLDDMNEVFQINKLK